MSSPRLSPQLVSYLDATDRARRERVARTLAALEPRERALVREVAVMGYVRGTLAGTSVPVPKDSAIVEDVLAACHSNADLYPITASLGGYTRPWSDREQLAAALAALHPRVCGCCGASARACDCREPLVCATCVAGTAWPCASVRVLGRAALCENVIDQPDMSAVACPGVLVFRPEDPQARCLECGAWCGAAAATYVDADG